MRKITHTQLVCMPVIKEYAEKQCTTWGNLPKEKLHQSYTEPK